MKKIKNKKGVTLVELIITMAISSLVILAVASVFASVVRNRRNVKIIQQSMENTGSAIEYMSKSLRMACNISGGGGTVSFANQSTNQCERYAYSGSDKKIFKFVCNAPIADTDLCSQEASEGCDGYTGCGTGVSITPAELVNATFNVQIPAGGLPRVTMKVVTSDKVMQTTVSTRDYSYVKLR